MSDQPPVPPQQDGDAAVDRVSAVLIAGERTVFVIVAALLFAGALALSWRTVAMIGLLFTTEPQNVIAVTAEFLDLILLILMIVEIAYTVTMSVRGAVLSARPFLIVGLIAVIRRLLLITVQEVQPSKARTLDSIYGGGLELGILTAVVLAFVFSLYLLGRNPEADRSDALKK